MDRDRYDHDETVGRADPQVSVGGGAAGIVSPAELELALTDLESAVTELAWQARRPP
jgi:hypothetical protein